VYLARERTVEDYNKLMMASEMPEDEETKEGICE